MVSVLAIAHNVCKFKPGRGTGFLKMTKTFLQRGSKAGGPMP
jgi:hypothetical protein